MRPVSTAVVLLLMAPATAAAQTTTTPTTPPPAPAPTTPTTPPPPPPPAAGALSLTMAKDVLTGHRIRVAGALTPAVGGQRVTVAFTRGRKTLRSVTVRTSARGTFVVGFTPRKAGRVSVRAAHPASPEIAAARATVRHVEAIATFVRPGQHSPSVKWLQDKLAVLHYAVSRSGTFDAATGRAVMAYRKYTGIARTEVANKDVFARLYRGQGAFKVRYPGHGRHVEGDLTHQVLALINPGGKVYRVFPTSSGKPSTPTVLGHYRFYSKTPGTNAKGMVDSNYFIRGYAIHGYVEVPPYAASHGCLRVPIPNAAFIYNWVRLGDRIDVYYR